MPTFMLMHTTEGDSICTKAIYMFVQMLSATGSFLKYSIEPNERKRTILLRKKSKHSLVLARVVKLLTTVVMVAKVVIVFNIKRCIEAIYGLIYIILKGLNRRTQLRCI